MTRTMTGDEEIDHLIHRIDASAMRLRLLAELSEREEQIVSRVDGGYLNTLIEKYNAMPVPYRTCEMEGGRGTPRDALIKALVLLVALLRNSEERISGMSAATIVLERDRLQGQVDALALSTDVPPIRFDPKPEPEPPTSRPLLSGALMVVAGLAVLFALVLVLAFFVVAGHEPAQDSSSSIPSWSVIPTAALIGWLIYIGTRKR